MEQWRPRNFVDYQGTATHGRFMENVRAYWNDRTPSFFTKESLARNVGVSDPDTYLELIDDGLIGVRTEDKILVFPERQFSRDDKGNLIVRPGMKLVMDKMHSIGFSGILDDRYPDQSARFDLPRGGYVTGWIVMANIFTNNREGGTCLVDDLESEDWGVHCEAYSDLVQLVDYLHSSRVEPSHPI